MLTFFCSRKPDTRSWYVMLSSLNFEINSISHSNEELLKFINLSQRWVIESDKNVDNIDLKRHRRTNQVEYCWITVENRIVGVVKIGMSLFYSLGLDPGLTENQSTEIFKLIILDISLTAQLKISSNVSESFWKILRNLGFIQEFGREKLALELTKAKKIDDFSDLSLEPLRWKKIKKITELFIDAYKGSIDEKIGIFTEPLAHSAIMEIKEGTFGKVMNELSYFVKVKGKLIGGIVTTLNERELFIVIIGIKQQNQQTGIGKKLISLIITKGKELGFSWIKLWVTRENTIAKRMYASFGFVKINGVIFSTSEVKRYHNRHLAHS